MNRTKDELIKIITTKNGYVNGYVIRNQDVIDDINYYSKYPELNIREKIFHIIHNIKSIPKCLYCNSNSKFSTVSEGKYSKLCGSKECKKSFFQNHSSKILKERWKDHIKPIKLPSQSKEDRYKQSSKTRKENNIDWFTPEQKEYIKKKRKETYDNPIKLELIKNKLKEIWKDPDKRKKQSNTIRKLINDGVFTPPITNSWTHWSSIYIYNKKEYKFRSSWEAAFWSVNKNLEFETLKILYTYLDKVRTYIVDFIDRENKIVYEVKPKDRYLDKEKAKEESLINWCNLNGYTYQLITQTWFIENYNLIDFENNEWLIKKMEQFKPKEI